MTSKVLVCKRIGVRQASELQIWSRKKVYNGYAVCRKGATFLLSEAQKGLQEFQKGEEYVRPPLKV